jgi:glycosyltransferase involved in cell wall biosynthesis
MNAKVLEWLSEVVRNTIFDGPVVEFGAKQPDDQVGYSDVRKFFTVERYVGCDTQEGPGVDLVSDMERTSFPPKEFRTVVCLETLEHVKHPWRAVREAHRILKPGGYLLISVPFRLPIHGYPSDYWRMTPDALEIMLRDAGFEEIETSDTGEEVDWDTGWDKPSESGVSFESFAYPHMSFAVARKPAAEVRSPVTARPDGASGSADSGAPVRPVEIIVPVYHREDATRNMFEQLARVTSDYSLVVVNNGFDDPGFLRGLEPAHYIENIENTGAIRPVNQGLELAGGKYACVLHNDLLIYEEGWLDHIIEFMERRADVGLVGLAGRHSIKADGRMDVDTTVANIPGYPASYRPTWRFTEVAAIDGLGWVMRNNGFRLDEDFGMMHYYDIDLSLQFIEAGFRVYVAGVEIEHLAEDESASTRSRKDYLEKVGGDDAEYYDRVAGRFRHKWAHLLPVTRGFADEYSAYNRIDDLQAQIAKQDAYIEELGLYAERLMEEDSKKAAEIEEASECFVWVDGELDRNKAEIASLTAGVRQLESIVDAGGSAAADQPIPIHHRFSSSLREVGLFTTLKKAARAGLTKLRSRPGGGAQKKDSS